MSANIPTGEKPEDEQEMVLVPRKPSKEMLEAAWAHALAEDAEGVWRSMISCWLQISGNSSNGKD